MGQKVDNLELVAVDLTPAHVRGNERMCVRGAIIGTAPLEGPCEEQRRPRWMVTPVVPGKVKVSETETF